MNATSKSTALLSLIKTGLQKHAVATRDKSLGDRSAYIGMSDIGRALECQRAALLRKLFPPVDEDLQQQIVLQRGKWLEHGIEQALASSKLHFFTQLELSTIHQKVPVKAHPDFVLIWEKPYPAVRILEMKSTENIPATMYSAYEAQVYGQIGLLRSLWNTKSFTGQSFPELCKQAFGLTLPSDPEQVSMEAWILCISMKDAKAFGPYRPEEDMLKLCLSTATSLWAFLQKYRKKAADLSKLEYASGLHPLCSYCAYNRDCPKFSGDYHPEWDDALHRLAVLKAQREALERNISDIEDMLKNAYASIAPEGWIAADDYRFKVTRHVRRSLDKELLRSSLSTHKIIEPDSLISACETEGQPYTRLVVNTIN